MIGDNKINNEKVYPLTHPQRRIWYIEKIYPDTSLYNIGGTIRIKGACDFSILAKAINDLVLKNEGLRLGFFEQNGEFRQYVSDYEPIDIDFKDFSKEENPEESFNMWVEKEAELKFNILGGYLFYFALFKISENDNGYLAKFHHIIADGWSINLMTEHICGTYVKLLEEEKFSEEVPPSYIDYIFNEKKYLLSDRFKKNKLFWNEKFKHLPETFLKKSSDRIEGKRKTYKLDEEVSSKIKEFAIENRWSLNTFFVTIYLIYLSKTTEQSDVVIGTPVLNRSGKLEKKMFGMFTSTMPFRFVLEDNSTVLDTINNVNSELMACYFNQRYPYDLLVQDLELKKRGYDNLFNVCVNYYNTKLNTELKGWHIENVEFFNGNIIYSMQLVIKEWSNSGCLTMDIDYKLDDYTDEQLDHMYYRLINLVKQVIENPYLEIKKLSLLSDSERSELLYQSNNTEIEYPKDKTIYQLFEEQVEKTPNKIAVGYNNYELTYRELNNKSNQLARYLIKQGVQKETIVGVFTTHSIETVIALLAILKAGGAYLPIDSSYPISRIEYMLEDSAAKILLTNIELPNNISYSGKIVNLNDFSLYTGEEKNLDQKNKTNDLVYVIYTSGSTGKPKGTMIEHRGLVNYVWWARKIYIKSEDDVFALYSSLAFDLTITSIFTPLISGNKILIYSDTEDETEYVLYRIIKENKANIIKLTPSQLSLLKDMDNKNSSVRRFIVGGEDLKVSLAKSVCDSFSGNIEIYNEYGPTETVVGCMIHKYNYENDTRISVPIGIPADNVQIYLLDSSLEPVPPYTVGEIYISGDGVARGYLNNPELTKEKFIANPFILGKRMYKTGDLARFIDHKIIESVGRADQQIKIRGYRIELGEIEEYLLKHKWVKDAVVVDCEEENSRKYLCAYIVSNAKILATELKEYLSNFLPDYMIPLYFIEVDEIPLTLNGKVDKKLLPEPIVETAEDEEPPQGRSEEEKVLVDAICDVLNLEKVSIKQNFYDLGGDSIKAIQIASKLNDKGYKVKVKEMLSYPILEELALHIKSYGNSLENKETHSGNIKSTPIAEWFFDQHFSNPNYYCQSVLLELKLNVSIERLEFVFNELIKHHDSLRMNYSFKTHELYYNNEHLDKYYSIQEHDLENLTYSEQFEKMSLIAEELNSSFNIESGILIKACVFKLGQNERKLLMTAHHLVVDGVSWRIIIDDINTLLKQVYNNQNITLPFKTHSYQKWAESLYRANWKSEKDYWEFISTKNIRFPVDYDLGPDTVDKSKTISVQLSEDETEFLMTKSSFAYNTNPMELLIVSLLRTIIEFTLNEEIIIDLEGHGREEFEGVDVTRTVGWFTSIYPFYTKLIGTDLSSHIKQVKEEIRKIPNKGIGYGILKYLNGDLDRATQSCIKFNYMGEFSAGSESSYVRLLSDQFGSNISNENTLSYIIDINCYVLSRRLNIFFTYSINKFNDITMDKFITCYVNNLKEIINHCCNKESVDFTLSDFETIDISQEELDSLF